MINILTRLFGSRNERLLKQYAQQVREINALEPAIAALADEELRQKTVELRTRVTGGDALDDVLPEAFAVVREAGKRTLNMRHFDVQLIGGIALHNGKIAEMRTGEGKTLVATLPAYLNALAGKGVHVVTVNDYLAQRDADWMGRIYRFLGLTVGVNLSQMAHDDKQVAYAADITYGTNNEFGFDYLRDNMVFATGERVQRGLTYAIVDEVDSILIDEARTPLIISGQSDDNVDTYYRLNELPPKLTRQPEEKGAGDYWVDEKAHQVLLSEEGHERVETLLAQAGLTASRVEPLRRAQHLARPSPVCGAARARAVPSRPALRRAERRGDHRRRVHRPADGGPPLVRRPAPGGRGEGRRADPAREPDARVDHVPELFPHVRQARRHDGHRRHRGVRVPADLSPGDDGHPDAPADGAQGRERSRVPHARRKGERDRRRHQGLPRARPAGARRHDVDRELRDAVDAPRQGAAAAPGAERQAARARGARSSRRPARPGVITIATNMAGRGTDIVLGGSIEPQILQYARGRALDPADKERQIETMRSEWQERHDAVIKAGGLHIIGTERHESRRIDNQLRGRAGRQGDPGSSRFYLSLEDPLLRIFGGERLSAIMQRLKMPEGEPIEHSIVNRSIAKAQNRVESRNFDIRKQLLEYDDVANDQRRVIYQQRNELLEGDDVADTVRNMVARRDRRRPSSATFRPNRSRSNGTCRASKRRSPATISSQSPVGEWLKAEPDLDDDELRERIEKVAHDAVASKEAQVGAELLRQFERSLMLQTLDQHWREHLSSLDHLRQGIHLRGYAQKNPKQEYKREAFELFSDMLDRIKQDVVRVVLTVQVRTQEDVQAVEPEPAVSNVQYQHADYDAGAGEPEWRRRRYGGAPSAVAPPFVRARARRSAATIRARAGQRQEIQALPRPAG